MSINQNSVSEFKNIFITKEEKHNFIILFLTIFLILFASVFLYECLKQKAYMGIFLVIIFYFFSCFKIITSSLLIIKLKKIKNGLEPERLNFYIYQSSWSRKKIATFWTTLSYLTIFLFVGFIYLIIKLINYDFTNFMFIFCGFIFSILGTIFVGFVNYKIINNNLIKGERYISTEKINSYDSISEKKDWNSLFKKFYIYLLFSLFIFPWIFMLNSKFKTKIIILIKK